MRAWPSNSISKHFNYNSNSLISKNDKVAIISETYDKNTLLVERIKVK